MKNPRFAVVVALALAGCDLFAAPPALKPGPVPVKDLFRDFAYGSMSMSPDGSALATVYPVEWEKGYFNALAVLDIETKKSKILHLNRRIPVIQVNWAGPNRLLVTVVGLNTGQYWALQTGLFSFDADGGRPVEIVKPGDASPLLTATVANKIPGRFSFGYNAPNIISWQTGTADEVLVANQKLGDHYEKTRPWISDGMAPLPGVYRLNVVTGKYSLHTPDPGWSIEWFADPITGKIRVAVGLERTGFKADGSLTDPKKWPANKVFWIGDDGKAEPITAIKLEKEEDFTPFGFEKGGKRFLFSGREGKDKAAVYAYDPVSKTVTGPFVENANVDIAGGILFSDHDGSVAGVFVYDGLPRTVWLDEQLKALQVSVDAALPGYDNRIVNWTRDYQRVLILSASTQDPGAYYLLDRKKGSLGEVYQRADWLRGATFGATKPIQLTSRDGVPLHGYLTRPPGIVDDVRTPLVLLVHGGPWNVRDHAQFDREVQFYATRGYSVLQLNFRRSAGYGRKFEELGRKQLGRTMQTDLDDAVDWAIAQGYADPKRLIIAGGSYGGYAALMGLVQHPERFQAGIAMFPLTDLLQQAEDYANDIKEKPWSTAAVIMEDFKKNVGDPVADRAVLEETSPNYQVARIKAPVFLVYGPKDEIIDKAQVRKFIGRMKAQKKTLVHFAPREEGHGIGDEERRLQVYTALEKFLQQYAPAN